MVKFSQNFTIYILEMGFSVYEKSDGCLLASSFLFKKTEEQCVKCIYILYSVYARIHWRRTHCQFRFDSFIYTHSRACLSIGVREHWRTHTDTKKRVRLDQMPMFIMMRASSFHNFILTLHFDGFYNCNLWRLE